MDKLRERLAARGIKLPVIGEVPATCNGCLFEAVADSMIFYGHYCRVAPQAHREVDPTGTQPPPSWCIWRESPTDGNADDYDPMATINASLAALPKTGETEPDRCPFHAAGAQCDYDAGHEGPHRTTVVVKGLPPC